MNREEKTKIVIAPTLEEWLHLMNTRAIIYSPHSFACRMLDFAERARGYGDLEDWVVDFIDWVEKNEKNLFDINFMKELASDCEVYLDMMYFTFEKQSWPGSMLKASSCSISSLIGMPITVGIFDGLGRDEWLSKIKEEIEPKLPSFGSFLVASLGFGDTGLPLLGHCYTTLDVSLDVKVTYYMYGNKLVFSKHVPPDTTIEFDWHAKSIVSFFDKSRGDDMPTMTAHLQIMCDYDDWDNKKVIHREFNISTVMTCVRYKLEDWKI